MTTKPIYRDRHARYEIDGCKPQNDAIRKGKINFHALTKGHYPGTPVPANILPGLNSIGYWNAGDTQDWGLDEHRNEGIEIMYLETGSVVFSSDQKKHSLRAGHFTITRPWQLHKLGAPNIGPGRLHWLILDVGVRRPHQKWSWPKWVVLSKEDLAELTRKLRHNENPVWNSTPAIAHSFREIARNIADWSQPHAVSHLVVHLNQLLIGVLDALAVQLTHETDELTSRRRAVEIFLQELENDPHTAGQAWTLDGMTAHCGMGTTAFSRYCRELVNAGPVEFLNRRRLDHAAQQLRSETNLSITEIAMANGFNSSQYFATTFSHRFQVSPTDYRKRVESVKSSQTARISTTAQEHRS
ncbi:MAG TPA: AraC family transcriptional regulator [Verrucomicrobiae bacterium]|nr:AraC family transcriptional regulator [Verrucomicrobiae bacterium]